MSTIQETSENLLRFCGDQKYATIYADPPWRFQNRTGKVAPEHKRLNRYETMELEDIMALPVAQVAAEKSHLYLWVPNALLPDGLAVMKAWGIRVQGQYHLGEGSQGRRTGRPGCGVLLPECDGNSALWCQGRREQDAAPGQVPGEPAACTEAGALQKTGRIHPPDRAMLSRAVS